MKFRKSNLKDARGIAEVLSRCYNIRGIKEGATVFKNETKKLHNYIVADDNGKIIGIVTWAVHGLPRHQLCELDRIAVLPEYRGKGVAKALFDSLVKDAKSYYRRHKQKLRKLYLLTHADNKRAHRLYEKLGLRHEAILKEHYYNGRDEHVYSIFFD